MTNSSLTGYEAYAYRVASLRPFQVSASMRRSQRAKIAGRWTQLQGSTSYVGLHLASVPPPAERAHFMYVAQLRLIQVASPDASERYRVLASLTVAQHFGCLHAALAPAASEANAPHTTTKK